MKHPQPSNRVSSHVVAQLHQQRDIIVAAWYQALVDVQSVTQSATVVYQHLTDLFEHMVMLLHAPVFDAAAARTIGAMLVEIGFDRPTIPECTINVLTQQFLQAVAPADALTLLPALQPLQGALVTGFVQRMQSKDVIQQHTAYTALRVLQQQTDLCLQMVLMHTPAVLMTIDPADRITFLAGKRLATLNILADELIGQPVEALAPHVPTIQQYVATAQRGESVTALVEVASLVFQTWWAPLYDVNRVLNGVICVGFDITTQKRLESEVVTLRQWTREYHTQSAPFSPAPAAYSPTVDSALVPLIEPRYVSLRSDREDREGMLQVTELDETWLTHEEREVLQLVVWGKTNRQIAHSIGLSKQGVAKRLTKLFSRLGVTTRTEASVRAVQLGLVSAPPNDVAA